LAQELFYFVGPASSPAMGGLCGKEQQGQAAGSQEKTPAKPLKEVKGDGFGHANFILDNSGKLTDFYECESKKLGQGSYGSVSKAVNKSTRAQRAVKSISKAHVKNIDRFKQEIAIMKIMDHPNIIKLYESFEDHRNIYLVMELATGGELFDRIIEAGHFTEVQAAIIMQQIFRPIFYMHENSVCHRDLKPENFLFSTKEGIEKTNLKIIDFGLSCKFEKDQVLTTKAGTPYYVAPQVLAGKYDNACDIWSCGVIMYVLLCGYPPFYGDTDADVLQKVRLGNFTFTAADWKGVSEDAKDLIRKTLKMNPRDRYTAEQCLAHVWVKNKAPKAANVPLEGGTINNMRSFRSQNKLKKAAMHVIAQSLGDSDLKNLKSLFMSLDKNGDGSLTVAELKQGLEQAGIADKADDLQEILKHIDADGSGQVDYTEFLAAAMDKKVYLKEETVWAAFRVFDRDGDGKITQAELKQVLSAGNMDEIATATQIQELMKDVDQNGDGEIDFKEFMEMMKKA